MSPIEKPKAENVPELADKFPKSKWQAILGVLDLVSNLTLRVQLLLASFGLVVALVCGWQLQTVLFNNQNNLARTLAATLVSTAYPHRGVTALLTAELDKNTGSESNNKELSDAVKAITENIKNLKTFDKDWEEKVIQDLDLRVMDKPDIPNTDKDRTWTQVIYSKTMEGLQRPAFLMVPAISLRQPNVGDNTLKNDQQLKLILQHNPEILFDFYVASKIDEQLDALGHLPHQPLTIVQAYFISESGVILLRQLPDSKSYKLTFPHNTLFMDRLYFWGAINPDDFRQDRNDHGPLDYETEPYVDLGGNGVVKTNSKRVELPNKRTGVICVDVVIPETEQQIETRLRELGANVIHGKYVESLVNPDEQSKGRLEAPEAESGFDWVNQLGKTPTSRITGAIAFESDFKTRTASDPEVVRFTIPIASSVNNNREPVTNLLLVTFNFRCIRLWIYIYAAGLVLGMGFFIFVMGNLLLQYTSLTREMNRVLVNMSNVMYEAATPFAWLNENNEFEEVNLSFLNVVGCKTKHELKNHAPQFKDLVTADTLPIYQEILELSAAGKPTPKYRIKIVRLDHEEVAVWAHGERVPYPTLGRRRPPHRFGVFLPDRETDLEQGEPAARNSDSGDSP